MSGPRQKIQYTQQRLALASARRGEPPAADRPGTEPPTAKQTTDRPAAEDQLMEEVCDRSNLEKAWKRVRGNKGSPGVDGLTIDDTATYLREHWPTIRAQLLTGTYTPQPVKRVDIPKPTGGVRRLGVPCVVDRPATTWWLTSTSKSFRPSQPRPLDSSRGRTGVRQARAQAHPGVSSRRGVGRRVGPSDRGGYAARRPGAARGCGSRCTRSVRASARGACMRTRLRSPFATSRTKCAVRRDARRR